LKYLTHDERYILHCFLKKHQRRQEKIAHLSAHEHMSTYTIDAKIFTRRSIVPSRLMLGSATLLFLDESYVNQQQSTD